MSTFLFNELVFGPIFSRRLGQSLGINLLPTDYKYCNFNCIYCECGWTSQNNKIILPTKEQFSEILEEKLISLKKNNQKIDTITFAGNGEPTIHPKFDEIIDKTIILRDKYFPNSKVAVLSNATMLHKEKIVESLKKIDLPILKLDSAFNKTAKLLNDPKQNYNVEKIAENFMKFNGNFIVQTMFLKGYYDNQYIDNTTDNEINAWLEILKKTKPKLVMIYTIARDTPAENLEKIPLLELENIAKKVNNIGIETQIAG